MRIFTSTIGTDIGTVVKADTIKHEGKLWIVLKWLVSPDERVQRPAYIIRIDDLPLQHTPGGPFGDYILLQGNIPKAVLDGLSESGPDHQFEVVQTPDIQYPIGHS
jgi:hypothetical protein